MRHARTPLPVHTALPLPAPTDHRTSLPAACDNTEQARAVLSLAIRLRWRHVRRHWQVTLRGKDVRSGWRAVHAEDTPWAAHSWSSSPVSDDDERHGSRSAAAAELRRSGAGWEVAAVWRGADAAHRLLLAMLRDGDGSQPGTQRYRTIARTAGRIHRHRTDGVSEIATASHQHIRRQRPPRVISTETTGASSYH